MADKAIEAKLESYVAELKQLQPTWSFHEGVDLDRWVREFPYDRLIADAERRGTWIDRFGEIVGPNSLVSTIYTQALLIDDEFKANRIPTDVFCWSLGEPANPAATKIGGRPFLPADMMDQWPRERNGPRFDFLGQICF